MKFSARLLVTTSLGQLLAWQPRFSSAQMFSRNVGRSMAHLPNGIDSRRLSKVSKQESKIDKVQIQMMQNYVTPKRAGLDGEMLYELPDSRGTNRDYCYDEDGYKFGVKIGGICQVHPLVVTYLGADADTMFNGDQAFDVYGAVSFDMGATWQSKNLSQKADADKARTYSGMCPEDHDESEEGEHRRLSDEGDAVISFNYPADASKPMLVSKNDMILIAWTSKLCNSGATGDNSPPPTTEEDDTELYGAQEDDVHDPEKNTDLDPYQVRGHQGCHNYTEPIKFGLSTIPFSCVWAVRGKVEEKDGVVAVKWTKPERLTSGRRDAIQLVAAVSGDAQAWALAWQEDPGGLRPGEEEGPGEGMSGATVNHKTDIWYSFLNKNDFDAIDWNETGSKRYPVIKRFSSPIPISDNIACPFNTTDGVVKGPDKCQDLYDEQENNIVEQTVKDGESKFFVAKDGIPLNGDTGASRAVMFLLPVKDKAPELIIAYEETKGLGFGGDDKSTLEDPSTAREDWGKNVIYHHFENFADPEPLSHGTVLNLPELDANGQPLASSEGQLLTHNARRPRLIAQSRNQMGDEAVSVVALWREGPEGHGKNADIMMRRAIGGPEPQNFECTNYKQHAITGEFVCVKGVKNLSKLNSLQLLDNEQVSPDDDGRAHRGFLRGDLLVVGYTYTQDWGRTSTDAGKGPPYDFFIRRSFDAGRKFTDFNGNPEDPVNLSHINTTRTPGHSVAEPRIYATPGDIKWNGAVAHKDDVQNTMVYYIAYGTVDYDPATGQEYPKSLYWSRTDNFGETYYEEVNPENDVVGFPALRRWNGNTKGGGFDHCQIRTDPAGTDIFATYQSSYDPLTFDEDVSVIVTDGETEGSTGGNSCAGGTIGNAVCFNSTRGQMTSPFDRFDINKDLKVDDDDLNELNNLPPMSDSDLDGDGMISGADKKLEKAAIEEFNKLQKVRSPPSATQDSATEESATEESATGQPLSIRHLYLRHTV